MLPRKPGSFHCFLPAGRLSSNGTQPLPAPPGRISDELVFRSCHVIEGWMVAMILMILTKPPWILTPAGSATSVSLGPCKSPGPWSAPREPRFWAEGSVGCERLGALLFTVLLGPPSTCPHGSYRLPLCCMHLRAPCLLRCRAFPRPQTLIWPPQFPACKPLGWDFQKQHLHIPSSPQLQLSLRSDLSLGGERPWTLTPSPTLLWEPQLSTYECFLCLPLHQHHLVTGSVSLPALPLPEQKYLLC